MQEERRNAARGFAQDLMEYKTTDRAERTVGQAVALYCRWLEEDADHAALTKNAYRRDTIDFANAMDELGINLLQDVDMQRIELWKMGLGNVAPATVSRKLSAVSAFFDWLDRWQLVAANPVAHVTRPRKTRKEARYLTPEHFQRLLGACSNPSEKALLGCLYLGGLRREETTTLTLRGVDLDRDLLAITGKGGHQRVVPVTPRLHGLLAEHLNGLDQADLNAPLFRNTRCHPLSVKDVNRRFRRWCRQAGLDHCGYTPHSARHGCGTLLGVSGTNAFDIATYLGHNDPRTTMGYVHNSPEVLRKKLSDIPALNIASDQGNDEGLREMKAQMAAMDAKLERMLESVIGRGECELHLVDQTS